MDPQEPRSKAPSLLAGDAQPVAASKAPERILSGLQGSSASASQAPRPRRWGWPAALLGVAVAALLLLDAGGVFEPSKPASSVAIAATPNASIAPAAEAQNHAADPAAVPAAGTARPAAQNAAVILADQFAPAAASTAGTAPAASASSKDTAALGAIFAPHAANNKPLIPAARAARRGDAASGDSDVDLLAVLINHLEVSDTGGKKAHGRHAKKASADDDVLPQDCPPANTEAGVSCRQRFCAAHAGQGDASCPAASPGGA